MIGPSDSVARARSVAEELGLGDTVLARTYASWQSVPDLIAELDPACGVLLFTGQLPYNVAKETPGVRASLDFVPHDGADLYRALVVVLHQHGGRLPRVSLDTIERWAVEETYRDLGFEPPSAVFSFEDAGVAPGYPRSLDVTTYHEQRFRRGEVDLCLTCIGSVRSELQALGIPVVRIEHTRAALREALRRASLTDRLARTEASQIAVAIVEPRERQPRRHVSGPYEAQRIELRRRQRAVDLAERLQGRLARVEDGSYLIHTTRGAITAEVASRDAMGEDVGIEDDSLLVGYGVGATVARAEANARQAAALGHDAQGAHVVLDDGAVLHLAHRSASARHRLHGSNPRLVEHARSIGVGTMTLARLVTAIAQLDAAAVTAQDLAVAYGVAPRSALRLLKSLEAAGVATAFGTRSAPRAGRPQTVYRIDVDRLLPADERPAEPRAVRPT